MLNRFRIFIYVLAVISLSCSAVFAESWSGERAKRAIDSKEMILIDIRTPRAWKSSGVPKGAWPLSVKNDGFTGALGVILKRCPGKKISFICARGKRSGKVVELLKKTRHFQHR